MGKEGVSPVDGTGNGVALVGPQGDLRVHPGKHQVAAVILPGPDGVELLVVQGTQTLPAGGVCPHPLLKLLLDLVLLVLGDGGFLFVEHPLLFAILVLDGIENPHVPEIQGVLDELVGVHPLGAVGVKHPDAASIQAFLGDIPLSRHGGIPDTDAALIIERRLEQLVGELLRHILGNPGSSQAHADFTSGQVLGLDLFQGLHIHSEGRVLFGCLPCGFQLFPHVTGEVLIRCDVVWFSIGFHFTGDGENDAPQLFRQLLLGFPSEGTHIFQIHPGFLPQGHSQGFGRRIHMGDGPVGLDGAFGKQVGLPF